jgi:hypothetical protein
MWPFKKSIPFEEYVKTLTPAPCGKQEKHYEWTITQGLNCPMCLALEKAKQKEIDDQKQAELIAEVVIKRLQDVKLQELWSVWPNLDYDSCKEAYTKIVENKNG